MPDEPTCGYDSDTRRCRTCGARKPANPHADDPDLREEYAQYQRERLGDMRVQTRAHEWPEYPNYRDVPEDEPLRGWRLWRPVEHDGAVLLCAPYRPDPMFAAAVWQPGANEASTAKCWARRCVGNGPGACFSFAHPDPSCWCGFRAMRSLTALIRFHKDQASRLGRWPRLAVAEVDLWGRTAGPAAGDDWLYTIRASRARIAGPLYVGAEVDAAALATRYEVETRPLLPLLELDERTEKP